jgi:hypothetical protein
MDGKKGETGTFPVAVLVVWLAFERRADAPSGCKQKWKEAIEALELFSELAKYVHLRKCHRTRNIMKDFRPSLGRLRMF